MWIGGVPGALIAALIADRWDRRWWIMLFAVLIALCGLAYGFMFRAVTIVIFGFAVAVFMQTFVSLLYAYTAECYPTRIRNSGMGLSYGVGRLANVLGPLLIPYLFAHYGYTSVFAYIASMWVVVAVVVGCFGVKVNLTPLP
jgi:putative MFS transporter